MYFVTLVLVFGLSGSAFAVDILWDGGPSGTGSDWTVAENWDGNALPGANDAVINDATVTQPLIVDGQNATAGRIIIGHDGNSGTVTVTGGTLTSSAGNSYVGAGGYGTLNISGGEVIANEGLLIAKYSTGTINMTAGALTVHAGTNDVQWWRQMFVIGDSGIEAAAAGTFNMSGGLVTVDKNMEFALGLDSSGTLNMTGGEINVTGDIYLACGFGVHDWVVDGMPGEINLDGGVVTANDLIMTVDGSLDLAGGTMILEGDDRVAIHEYIDNGWITGYGVQYTVIVDYDDINLGKTTLVGTDDPNFNAPPMVDAGSYQSVLLSAGAQLGADVSDDGKPNPPGVLTYTWSGPDGVSFDPSSNAENPTAIFTAAGFYELRLSVSDSDKDACDVVTIYVRPDDEPIAHWNFEEGLGGSDVLDVNGNDGVIAGDLEPNWVGGWIGDWAMYFYGSDDPVVNSYVDITSNVSAADPNLDNLRYDVTLSAWFKIGDLAITYYPVIVANGDQGWRLYANHDDGGTIVFTPGDGVITDWTKRTTSAKLLDDGYWHHVVGMYDYANSKSYLYIDGVPEPDAVSEDQTGMMAEADDKPVTIGARAISATEVARGWNGGIDDVQVYSYCISEAHIAALADMGDLVPQVSAGEDQTVLLQDGAVQLAGTATDDGKPNLLLDLEWTKFSGAGTATFLSSADIEAPTVTFSEADIYVLHLTANDGNAEVFDEVTITVNDPTCEDVIGGDLLKDSDISGPDGDPDCYVNLYDFAAFAGEWLSCNDPSDPDCEDPF